MTWICYAASYVTIFPLQKDNFINAKADTFRHQPYPQHTP